MGQHTFDWSQYDVFSIPHWNSQATRRQTATPNSLSSPTRSRSSASVSCARNTNNPTPPLTSEGIGASVRRVEDPKFLRGQGCYVADITLAGELHCVLVRSPHAHARILKIDSASAVEQPGVAAVFTGADMATDKIGPMVPLWAIKSADGKPMAEPPRWALARGTVRHVGEAVAAVIAGTLAQARDAADLVQR